MSLTQIILLFTTTKDTKGFFFIFGYFVLFVVKIAVRSLWFS